MKLLANTVLEINSAPVCYEVLSIGQLIIFKPCFYHLGGDAPCIVLGKSSAGWQLQTAVDDQLKKQVGEDMTCFESRHPIRAC